MKSTADAGSIPSLTDASFDPLVLKGKGPIAVEFMSYGCSHCRAIEPALQEVAQRVHATEQIYRVNVAAEQSLASTYAIEGTPTLVMFLDGAEVGRVEGPHPSVEDVLRAVTQPFAP